MSKKITGIIPPVITSFDKDGNFDESAQREVVRFLVDEVDGLFPTGTYGAGPMMSIDERKKVMEVIVDEVNGKIPVIFMVGAPSTRDAVELAEGEINKKSTVGTISYMPAVFGCFCASGVINDC